MPQLGLEVIMANPGSVNDVAMLFDVNDHGSLIVVLEIFVTLCVYSTEGHR